MAFIYLSVSIIINSDDVVVFSDDTVYAPHLCLRRPRSPHTHRPRPASRHALRLLRARLLQQDGHVSFRRRARLLRGGVGA